MDDIFYRIISYLHDIFDKNVVVDKYHTIEFEEDFPYINIML